MRSFTFDLDDEQKICVTVHYAEKCKSIRLTFKGANLRVSAPPYTPLFLIKILLKRKKNWVKMHFQSSHKSVILTYEKTFVFLDQPYLIKREKLKRPGVYEDKNILWINSDEDSIDLFLEGWAKKKLFNFLHPLCTGYARHIEQTFNRITIKKATTRWGSCSAKTNLNFNWRLIFAPVDVIRYLAAHEVAHLQEMNHGKDFWRLVATLDPLYLEHRKWLRIQGRFLLNAPITLS